MIASELISNVVPVLKPEDTCLQALIWMLWSICAIATAVAFIWFPEHAELWNKVAPTQIVVFGIPSAFTMIRLNYLRRAKK